MKILDQLSVVEFCLQDLTVVGVGQEVDHDQLVGAGQTHEVEVVQGVGVIQEVGVVHKVGVGQEVDHDQLVGADQIHETGISQKVDHVAGVVHEVFQGRGVEVCPVPGQEVFLVPDQEVKACLINMNFLHLYRIITVIGLVQM